MHNDYVKWNTFKTIITIATAIIGVLLTIQINLMASVSEMKSDISAIRTDLVWIKGAMKQNVSLGETKNELVRKY